MHDAPPTTPYTIGPLGERFALYDHNGLVVHTSYTPTGPLQKWQAELTNAYQSGWLDHQRQIHRQQNRDCKGAA